MKNEWYVVSHLNGVPVDKGTHALTKSEAIQLLKVAKSSAGKKGVYTYKIMSSSECKELGL